MQCLVQSSVALQICKRSNTDANCAAALVQIAGETPTAPSKIETKATTCSCLGVMLKLHQPSQPHAYKTRAALMLGL